MYFPFPHIASYDVIPIGLLLPFVGQVDILHDIKACFSVSSHHVRTSVELVPRSRDWKKNTRLVASFSSMEKKPGSHISPRMEENACPVVVCPPHTRPKVKISSSSSVVEGICQV